MQVLIVHCEIMCSAYACSCTLQMAFNHLRKNIRFVHLNRPVCAFWPSLIFMFFFTTGCIFPACHGSILVRRVFRSRSPWAPRDLPRLLYFVQVLRWMLLPLHVCYQNGLRFMSDCLADGFPFTTMQPFFWLMFVHFLDLFLCMVASYSSNDFWQAWISNTRFQMQSCLFLAT